MMLWKPPRIWLLSTARPQRFRKNHGDYRDAGGTVAFILADELNGFMQALLTD